MAPAEATREDRALGVTPLACATCESVEYVCEENGHAYPLPAAPTRARAGSAEKVEVMRRRAERREAVFHPGDSLERERAPSAQTGGGLDRAVAERNRELPRGVMWSPRHRRYRAKLWDRATKKTLHLGLFDRPEDAAAAVRAAREALAANRANGPSAKNAANAALPATPKLGRKGPTGGRTGRQTWGALRSQAGPAKIRAQDALSNEGG
jgi:hypothetical protein